MAQLLGRRLLGSGAAAAQRSCCVVPATASMGPVYVPPSAAAIATVINWAYRGKYAGGDKAAWTGESHLLSGVRTSSADVEDMVERCSAFGADEALLLAVDWPPSGKADTSETEGLLGTVHLQLTDALGVDDAGGGGAAVEIGMLSVDPDWQGHGIGGKLLDAAEATACVPPFSARTLVMNILAGRPELQSW